MITSAKMLAIAMALLATTLISQSTRADNFGLRIGIGNQIRQQPRASVGVQPQYSAPIYYSPVPYTPPSIIPPSMNILPSYGYSTGFYTQPTSYAPPIYTPNAIGLINYMQPSYMQPTYYQPLTTFTFSQTYYYSAPAYNYTTIIPQQPRLSHGFLRR